ncbi:MAG TPA: hypothetical protein VFN09_11070 [Rhodanobacteraceae bacterium]|nr:hypothetical protein [Rhodanobacteraceae bacterium]
MRIVQVILGVLALSLGIWVLTGKASYPADKTLVKIGSAELTAKTDKPVPQWWGLSGLIVGGVLIYGGIVGIPKR